MLLCVAVMSLCLSCTVPIASDNTDTSRETRSSENNTNIYINDSLTDISKMNIEVENLDVGRLTQKLNGILLQYGDENLINMTRRQALHNREGIWGYRLAERYRTKRKTLDMMVQLLYMARQKLRMMETSEFFDTKSFGFRIAYAHRKIQRLWRNLGVLYRMSLEKAEFNQWTVDIKWVLILHHKAARLHLDFTYLFWVIMKLDVVNKQRKRRARVMDMIKGGKTLPEGLSIPKSWG